MSAGFEHREYSEALAAYALDAASEAEAERVRRHLSTCAACRAEFDRLRQAVDALPASVEQINPPPELKARLMEIVQAEAELLRAAGERADRPPVARARRWRWLLAPRPALALAAGGLAVIALVAGLVATSGGPGTRTLRAQIVNPTLAGQVRASLELRGASAQLRVSGLPAPAADHVDEIWVKHGGAAPTPAGTFVVQSGSVQVARPVHPGDMVLVTVEPSPGRLAPTSQPFMLVRV